ncbi:hypothetical protein PSTT_12608 [Puccinia striiformis]|uniref:60S ribosomal protein L31 n=1 Tax=Puccinia striiformis TaxID=27350 RepID=A0A2S4UVH5_9BASI|nr:hypothetical protein PSTT_12608 [Puccinia striiformis]
MAPREKKERKARSALSDVVTREYTIHLHKHVFGHGFKKRAPKAVKALSSSHEKQWEHKTNVPRRMRVRLARQRNDDEDSKEKLYTLATFVEVADFKGLDTQVVETDDA